MTARITYPGKSGSVSGELAVPSGEGHVGAVLVLQEYWGVNGHIKGLCERLAGEGFLALAPDLYDGKVTTTAEESWAMLESFDFARGVDHIAGAKVALEKHPRANGKVGVLGFCMGGALALKSACEIAGLSAVIPFYGVPQSVDYSRVTAPVQAHYAKQDAHITPAKAEAVRDKLRALDKSIELFFYDADHAFFNDTRPEVYSKENATLAWDRTIAFLKKHLS